MTTANPAVQAVIFDLDDTLYPEVDYVISGLRLVARHLARPGLPEQVIDDALWQNWLNGPRSQVFDRTLAQLHLPAHPQMIAELVSRYRCHRPGIRLEPPVADLLERLRPQCKLGLITDGFLPAQKLKVEALRLEEKLDRIIYTEELGREFWKPNPRAFEEISRALECPPECCVYVADNLAKDFVAPNGLGWLTIRLVSDVQTHREETAPPGGQPQLSLGRLDDLPELLKLKNK